jgi:hypothetical protein
MDTSVRRPAPARRSLLGRGLLLAAGAIGLGWSTAGAQTTQEDAPTALPSDDPAPPRTLELAGRNWHLQLHGRKRGERAENGDQLATFGELHAGPDGHKVGEFYASGVYLGFPLGESSLGAATSEVHTFRFVDGTIVGMGTVSGAESVFPIIGGTGRYAGATGSYAYSQSPYELGGDGTAMLRLTIAG